TWPEIEYRRHAFVDKSDAKPDENHYCRGSASLSRLQDLGAGGAFWVFQLPMLLNDEGTPQRDHHQNAEQTSEHRNRHDADRIHLKTEQEQRRHGDADTEGD